MASLNPLPHGRTIFWLGLALLAGLGYALLTRQATPAHTFATLSGEKVVLERLRGKVVLVNFWATTCAACVREMPELAATYLAYRDRGLEVIAVAMPYDPPNRVLEFAVARALPFHVALDIDGTAVRAFGDVEATPATFLIGRDGGRVERIMGELDFPKLHAMIDRQLAE